MSAVEIGLGFQSDKTGDTYADLARRAESYGFDVLSVFGDLMFQPPIFPLLTMARETTRVRLGPACLNPYSLHPCEIAGQLAALDLASHGRAYLGLARGAWLDTVGLAQARPVTAIREAASMVHALLRGEQHGLAGEMFSLSPGAALRFHPQRPRLPLLIGTWGPRTAALAGQIADEVKIGGTANPAMIEVMRRRIRSGTVSASRHVDDVGIVAGAVTVVDEDGDAARHQARAEVAMYLPIVAAHDPTIDIDPDLLAKIRDLETRGERQQAGSLVSDELLDLFAFSGTPQHVAHQARALIDAGARRIEFGTPHGLTDRAGVDLLGTHVLPLLR